MAEINVNAAILAGFGLIRRHPLSVIVWGLAPVLLQGLAIVLLAPLYAQMISNFSAVASGATPTPASSGIFALEALAQLVNLLQILLYAMVYCAVWRAVLHPERSAFAYLRIGVPELLFALLWVGASMVIGFGSLFAMIPAAFIGTIAGAAAQSVVVGFAVGVPVFIAILVVVAVLVGLRFAFVGPMMVADNKFRFLESWTLTKGKVGSLFMIGLGLFLVFILIDLVIAALVIGVGAGVVSASGGITQFVTTLRASPAATLASLWPYLAVYLVVMIPVSGCLLAIGAAPWAKAYQDLIGDQTVATFA